MGIIVSVLFIIGVAYIIGSLYALIGLVGFIVYGMFVFIVQPSKSELIARCDSAIAQARDYLEKDPKHDA